MDLSEALLLGDREVVALVGGGGKTTIMYRLCREAVDRGRTAVASGTARFTAPPLGAGAILAIDEDETRLLRSVSARLKELRWLVAAAGRGSKGRLEPISYDCAGHLSAETGLGLLVLEADGSAMRPFKAPGPHEPAIPPAATLVLAVAGLDVLGRPLTSDYVHRPERVAVLSGAALGERITPEIVATVLAHPEGGRRRVPVSARFAVVLNKVSDDRLTAARHTARLLVARGVARVVLARAREERPVVELIEGRIRDG